MARRENADRASACADVARRSVEALTAQMTDAERDAYHEQLNRELGELIAAGRIAK